MNAKIKQLVQEAFDTADYPESQQYRIVPNAAFCEKFTELIVLECAAIAKDSQDYYDEHNDGVCNDDIGALLKHAFGVKE